MLCSTTTTSSRLSLLPLLKRCSPPTSSIFTTTTTTATVTATTRSATLVSRSGTAASVPRLFSSSTLISRRFFSPSSQTTSSPIYHRIRQFSSSSIRCFAPTAATMGVTEIQSYDDWTNKVLEDSKSRLVVVDCHATWCGPCKVIAPKIEEFSNTYTNVGFYKVDVDEVPQVAQELGVRAMPTIVYLKDGGKADEFVGAVPPAIEGKIKTLTGAA